MMRPSLICPSSALVQGFAPVPGRGNYPHDDRGAMLIAKIGCCLGAQQDEGCEIADLVDAGADAQLLLVGECTTGTVLL